MIRTLLALAILAALPALAAETRRADFSSAGPEIADAIQKKIPAAQLEKLTPAGIDAVLRELQALPGVEQAIAVEGVGDQVRFEIRRAKRVGSIAVSGAHALTTTEVQNLLGYAKDDVFQADTLVDAGERLRAAYKEIGFQNTQIDIEYPSDKTGLVALNVRIDEGPRTEIRIVRVQSDDPELNTHLQEKISSLGRGALNDTKILSIQNGLREDLRKNNHLRAEIAGPEIKYSADETAADITFRITKVESYSVDFRGQREFSSIDLEDDVLQLDKFVSSNPNIAAEMAEKIRQAYLARGFARVEIQTEETEGRTPFQRRVIFTINEGPKVQIERYAVAGRVSRPADYYGDYVKDHSSKLVSHGYYNREDLETGFKNLITELQNQGYLLAKMSSTRTQYNREKTKITVHMNLDEGPLTLVEKVAFTGNAHISTERLRRDMDLKEGQPLKLSQIEKARTLIKTTYQEAGFIEMQLAGKPEDIVSYNEDNTRVSLNFQIEEGAQVRVGSIILDGNAFTKDYVLLNELDFAVGDLLTPSKIEESTSRLQRTGHFNSVEIKTLEEKTLVSSRTVIVKVTERNPGLFTLGAGATNENGITIRGYTGVAYRNLWGTGRGVSLRVDGNYNISDIKYPEYKVALGYLEPYLLDTRNRGRVNLTRSTTVTDYSNRIVSQVVQTTYSIERDFSTHVTGIWDVWSLAAVENFTLRSDLPNYKGLLQDIAWTGLSLDVDYRDNPFVATKGTLSKFAVEYGSPLFRSSETIEYALGTATFNFYNRLGTSPVIWANQLRGGYLVNYAHVDSDQNGVPWDKKGFVLGGRSTIRGFEAGTTDVFPNFHDLGLSSATETYFLKTNAAMGLIKSELRFPIYDPLEGALFYDGGTVRIDGLDFEDNYRDSAGFGIRIATPVGPVSLEFGFKLDRKEGEEPWRFHLSMGAF